MYLLIQIYFIQLELLGNTFIKYLCLERSERNDTFDDEIFNALVEKKFSHQRLLFLSLRVWEGGRNRGVTFLTVGSFRNIMNYVILYTVYIK